MALYKIQAINSNLSAIHINEKIANAIGINEIQNMVLSYGRRKLPVNIIKNSFLDENTIQVSDKVIKQLLIDTNVEYEINVKNNEIIIGPLIGLLLARSEKKLQQSLTHCLIYTLLYDHINGLLFVFSEDLIDFDQEQVSGYLYDPDFEKTWRKVTLPFPGAIFRRVELSKTTLRTLTDKMEKSFFNPQYFDKWQFWKVLSQNHELKEHLPETTNKVYIETVDAYLEEYGGAYLKPKNGSRGKGIYYIEKKGDLYKINKNYENEIRYLSIDTMKDFLSQKLSYLLQQPIQLQTFKKRKVDYRVLLQKNITSYWQCTGIIARFGKTNAISSNFKSNGFAKEGAEALMIQFGYDELKAFQKYQEIIHICIKMACEIDRTFGTYADLGIDIGIDEEEKIWVIEMNKRPDHDFPLIIKDRKMYYQVKTNPIFYAKFVSMGY